jgi:4-oxalocrotonate tautomerase
MPHIIVKMYPGRSQAQIERLAKEITRAVVANTGCAEKSVSIAVEEVAPEKWVDAVYVPDIRGGAGRLVKKPGYDPFA